MKVGVDVALTRLRDEVALEASTVTDDEFELTGPSLSDEVPLAVAVLVTEPASTSAWVTV